MKIYCSRKDDILKRKAEYEKQVSDYHKRDDESRRNYQDAYEKATKPIYDYIVSELGKFTALQFDVDVQKKFGDCSLGVRIECDENRKFEDNSALSWNYEASIVNGEIVKESSSWSGLKATNKEQMESLKQTVQALEFLNDIDWDHLINVELPKYEDYFDVDNKLPRRPNFEQELAEAEIEDLIGANKAILIQNWDSCPYKNNVYMRIKSESPSQYSVDMVGTWRYSDKDEAEEKAIEDFKRGAYRSQRVRKVNVKPVQPIQVIDLE